MASKRVAKSAIDWVALGTKVPKDQHHAFDTFKKVTDNCVFTLTQLPSDLPKIDFAQYKSRIVNTAWVDEFEKKYSALSVPYPKDVSDEKGRFQKAKEAKVPESKAYMDEMKVRLSDVQEVLGAIDSVPPPHIMTHQMMNYYFPDRAQNPNRPIPGNMPFHNESEQFHAKMRSRDSRIWYNKSLYRNYGSAEVYESDIRSGFERYQEANKKK